MKMSNGFVVIASARFGDQYGHTPGRQYDDVEVGIGQRGSVYRVCICETWGSYNDEHGRRKVVARGADWQAALRDCVTQAKDSAGIGDVPDTLSYLTQAVSAVRDEMGDLTDAASA